VFNPRLLMAAAFIGLAGCGPAAVSSPTTTLPAHTAAPATASAQAPAAATAGAPVTTLGKGDEALDAGTYRFDLAQAPTVRDANFPAVRLTVPAGWSNHDGWLVHRGDIGSAPASVQFWNVDEVLGHPCHWKGTETDPGRTVDDLVAAFVAQPLRNATAPVDTNIDGYAGKYLEWSVPADIDFEQCDSDGTDHYFESWTGHMGQSDRYQQGPGQVDRLWILDVGGSRLVIDAFYMPSATDAERQQISDIVSSLRFDEP
jgi:hypothetical protein